jgi:RND superfamily putative drug exporter
VLLPAVIRLAGAANWWAPPPLRRLHERFGITESVVDSQVETAGKALWRSHV